MTILYTIFLASIVIAVLIVLISSIKQNKIDFKPDAECIANLLFIGASVVMPLIITTIYVYAVPHRPSANAQINAQALGISIQLIFFAIISMILTLIAILPVILAKKLYLWGIQLLGFMAMLGFFIVLQTDVDAMWTILLVACGIYGIFSLVPACAALLRKIKC